ncbi:MAG: dihydrofolate reductase [Alphaproteobacteria bacterium]|nr:dihydrofolate reductase [Alphaproteobacteria bacterium]
MALGLIYARTRNGVIGRQGQMPWHLPEDLAHFKRVTLGQPVIMGRKTWDSIPPRFRPLPGRVNWVITRQTDWQAPGARVAHSLTEALQQMPPDSQPWVMGGGEIYAQAMPLATHAVVTEIDLVVEDGDTFAPQFDSTWVEVARESKVSTNGLGYDFVQLKKNT